MAATTATTWPWLARRVGPVCSTVDGVSVITKCARLSISSSIMLAHQASSRPGGGASAGVRALHQPASCFIFDGDRRYVPGWGHGHGSCTLVHSPHRPTPSHIWHWAAAPPPDLTAAGPTPGTGTYLGRRYGGTCPLPPLGGRVAAQAGCVTAMFPARRPRALGKYFCLVPGPVKSRPCRDHAVTAVQTPEVPLALVPADALPPPSLASHLRQGMAGRGRALTDRLTPLQHAFWPSFSRNGQSWNGLPRRAHHGRNYKCPPSHLSHVVLSPSAPSSDQTSSKQFSCSCLTALRQSVQDTNTALHPTTNQTQPHPANHRTTGSPLFDHPAHNSAISLVNRKARSPYVNAS